MIVFVIFLFVLLSSFVCGFVIGIQFERKSVEDSNKSSRLLEMYNTLHNDCLENDMDFSVFFKSRSAVIYGVRGKYGSDFFHIINDLSSIDSLFLCDGNAKEFRTYREMYVYEKNEIVNENFDYLVILPLNHYFEIRKEFISLGVNSSKICSLVDVILYLKLERANE